MVERFVVISGCSGGGKSTLLAELARRGYATVAEPGRRIVREELAGERRALPWVDEIAFARRAITMAMSDRAAMATVSGWVFFDRSLIDAASALQNLTGEPALGEIAAHPYHRRVFLTPPWPEIYETDPERRHSLADALPEYERLLHDCTSLGYKATLLPKVSVEERADFILETLAT